MGHPLSTKQIIRELKEELSTKLREYDVLYDPKLKEYPLVYKNLRDDLKLMLRQNPRCDACVYSKKPIQLVHQKFEIKGCATWTVAKLWFYVKNGGKFDSKFDKLENAPRKIRILHFLSDGLTQYDVFVAKELGEKLNEELGKKGIGEYKQKAFDLNSNHKKIVSDLAEKIAEELKQ